ncbi:MAG: hypothetical protein IPH31_02575 [Lewinellaceae bacterium]|nr:hypothetical protein [Lewinellaceae bacterium]
MEKSKLAQLLLTFSKEELRELAKFAATPFFNPRPEAASLLRLLSKTVLAGKPLPGKEQVFRQIFDKEKFDDHRVRMAMTALLQTTEKFLAVRDFLHDKPAYQIRLSKVLRARSLPVHADIAWKNGSEALERRDERNAEYHYDFYKFEEEKFRVALDTPDAGEANLQALSDQLDVAVLSRKLWQGCFLLAHQARYNADCDFGFLNQMLPFAKKHLHLPAISIYYHCYLALTQPDENQYFQAFKKDLIAHDALFPPSELRDLYILAINFCTRRYNEGDHSFLRDQFDLYKIGFDKNYFLSEGVLSRFTYLNAATNGLVLREFAWVEDLIKNHRRHLDPAHREALFSFNMARLEYQKRNFGEALQLLQRAEYKETMLALAAKTIQLKIYYETDEYDLLESHLQAIAAFIRRKKVMGYHRENYLNLVQFVRKLLVLNPLDKKEKQAFREAVEEARPLAEKEWLLGQVN